MDVANASFFRPLAAERTRRLRALLLRTLFATGLVFTLFVPLVSARPASTQHGDSSLQFPKPSVLSARVEFWRRIYTEFGVGDFVLHDRENLAIIYDVVHVNGTTNERRASEKAAPGIRRLRARYASVLTRLARGVPPESLGVEGRWVAQAWGCPCSPKVLLGAAGNLRVQQGIRERVDEGIGRARSLMPQILSILRRHNLPLELAALPLVESSFNPHARSKAGAVGLWQFITATGRWYLNITGRRDDRLDPIRATEAAAQLLRDNYEALGSWPLALLAYNHGKAGIMVAKVRVGSSAVEEIIGRYNGPRFGFASKNFYPEFLAALDLVHPVILAHSQSSDDFARDP